MSEKAEIIGIAVVWDEFTGPEIISISPKDSITDPQSIALQIYMSAATVFGQRKIERVEFSLPLLSWSLDSIVRVMFDTWVDQDVRGGERPCYIAFIMTKEISEILYKELNTSLSEATGNLKKQKENFNINNQVSILEKQLFSLRQTVTEIEDLRSKISQSEYSIASAQRDLIEAAQMWENNNINALGKALQAANRLKGIDYKSAADAFFLTGTILFQNTNYSSALENFQYATKEYESVDLVEEAAESSFNTAICYYRLGNYDEAKEKLFLSAPLLKDENKKAQVYLYLGLSLEALEKIDESRSYFQLGIDSANKATNLKFAAQISDIYASTLTNRAKKIEKKSDDELYLNLMKTAAKHRGNAGNYYLEENMFRESGASFSLAASIYENINDVKESQKYLIVASDSYKADKDFLSASKSLLKAISLNTKTLSNPIELLQKVVEYSQNLADINSKNYWLGIAHREIARINEKNLQYIKAINSYNQSLSAFKVSLSTEYVSVLLKKANLYFRVENFINAAIEFEQALILMTEKNIGDVAQRDRCQKNALKSYKLAAAAYIQVANVYLFNKKYEESLDFYELTLVNSKKARKLLKSEVSNDFNSWFNSIVNRIKTKIHLFEEENHKQRLLQVLSINE